MLYINVYMETQLYGGPEEGGWYYQAGEPLASIPVDSDYKPGKDFYLSEGVHIRDCHACSGTGEVVEDCMSETDPPRVRCQECGTIPEKPEEVWKAIEKWQEFFKDSEERHQTLVVRLQEHFATSYPDKRPHYE